MSARRGFTLIEIVVATAIVAVLGATILLTLTGYSSNARVRDSYEILRDLNGRLHRYDSLIGNAAVGQSSAAQGRYPSRISHLVIPIVAATSTAASDNCLDCKTSCYVGVTGGNNVIYGYNATPHKAAWDAKGPFYNRNVVSDVGFAIPIGFVKDRLVRVPLLTNGTFVASEAGILQIQIDSVLEADALDLESIVDGGVTSAAAGTIRWDPSLSLDAAGKRPIFWASRVRGC